jgi:glycine/D-amino acid oxidase-like deaminating enzyme
MGALSHPPGGIIRHDAVVWGYARGADRAGVEIQPYTEVQGFDHVNGRVTAVRTNRGTVRAGQVVSATAGWSTLVCGISGVELPITLLPQLEHARLLRAWAGLCDLSPDYSPILGRTEVENFHISAAWGTYGFDAAPIVGKTLAELRHTGWTPELIAPFALERFYEDRLVSELAAAAVSH